MALDVGVYLPQIGMTWDELRARAIECDELGISSVWLMDHLYPPGLPRVPSFEAWTAVTALAAATKRVRFGHLVLCNGFRHPALLAKMAITLDHASGGRLDLGIGSGSYRPEFEQFGFDFGDEPERAARLGEALEVLKRLFTEAVASFDGRYYPLREAPSLPRPLQTPHPPIHVGGAGEKRTLPLAARHADVWNCPTYALAALPRKLEVLAEECERIGRARSTLRVTEEAVLALVERKDQVDAARTLAEKRFAGPGWGFAAGGYLGTPDDIVRRIRERVRLGVDGFVFFFHDRVQPSTLRLLAHEVIPALR
jgi:alkanesulfonate monooxygenase SsuD/methylene tetrahydromethanopterin reductase-like flavin-dependent oxidoreductase (luciferase family)